MRAAPFSGRFGLQKDDFQRETGNMEIERHEYPHNRGSGLLGKPHYE